MPQIAKAYAITDAKIGFVSLVDKASNKRTFLITKAADGSAAFATYGRILKTDTENHFVTGIVYEPMVEDSQGNYMTEAEITKAAHWFMKNGGDVDLQHCFKKCDGAKVVESYIAKCDMEIEGQEVKKGTWVMTMEITDANVWKSIQKGEITGFSMGGSGVYSEENVDLSTVEKSEEPKGLLKKLAKALGFDVVEKGAVKDYYNHEIKEKSFSQAWYALDSILHRNSNGGYGLTDDESSIREALTDFNDIVTQILASDESIIKALQVEESWNDGKTKPGNREKSDGKKSDSRKKKENDVEKAGKSLSSKNLNAIKGIYDTLGDFLSEFDEGEPEKNANSTVKKEDADMTNEEVQKLVSQEVAKAMEPITKALEPIMKSRALPGNLNGAKETVKKQETHYLHGIV